MTFCSVGEITLDIPETYFLVCILFLLIVKIQINVYLDG